MQTNNLRCLLALGGQTVKKLCWLPSTCESVKCVIDEKKSVVVSRSLGLSVNWPANTLSRTEGHVGAGGWGDLKKHSFTSLPKPRPHVPLCTREPVHRLSVNMLFSRGRGLLPLPLAMWATRDVAFCNYFVGDYFCCCEKEISHKCITEISHEKKKDHI